MISRRMLLGGALLSASIVALPVNAGSEVSAEERLAKFVHDLESRYSCVDGPRIYKCPTGQEYVTLMSGGVKDEGEEPPKQYPSKDAAVDAYISSFSEYASVRSGVLYWRMRPEIGRHYWHDVNMNTGEEKMTIFDWVVRSRLLIA